MNLFIVDLDGTLWENNHRLHLVPEDMTVTSNWELFDKACVDDTVILPNIEMVRALVKSNATGYKLLFLTSRGVHAKEETRALLKQYFGDLEYVIEMRELDDQRTPVEYKEEKVELITNLFDSSVGVVFIDDNPDICKTVRSLMQSIVVIQVPSQCCSIK